MNKDNAKISHLLQFWKYTFKTTKSLAIIYIAVVTFLAILKPLLAIVWNEYIDEIGINVLNSILLVSSFFVINFLIDLITRYTKSQETIERLDIIYANKMREKTQSSLFKKLSKIPTETYETPKINDKINHVFRTIGDPYFGLGEAVMRSSYVALGKFLSVIFSSIALFIFHPLLSLLVFVLPIPSIISTYKISKANYLFTKNSTQVLRKMKYFQNLMIGKASKELYVFGIHDFIASKWRALSSEYTRLERKLYFKNCLLSLFSNFISVMSITIGYVFAISLAISGYINLGMLAAVLGLVTTLSGDISVFFSNISNILSKKYDASLFYEFINLEEEKVIGKENFEEIEFENVSYKYPEKEGTTLTDINIKIKKGEKIAVVGENGAGKTTFSKLLIGQLTPTTGAIVGNNIEVGIVLQNPARYETFSLEDNIRIADTNKNLDVEESLKFVELTNINKEEILGASYGGIDLSGGQWQKLGISRAVYRDRDFIVLDEPTGNLDPIVEASIFSKYIKLGKNKTVIFVTHRISAASLADRIIVFKDGRIVGDGTKEELLREKNSEYSRLFNEQARWYK